MDQGGFFMCNILSIKTLEDMKAGYATLGVAGYTLPVPFRVHGQTVECRVPTWSGVGDLLEITRQVTLVVVQNSESGLRWVFLRGLGNIIEDPDWEDFGPLQTGRINMGDLYELLRIEPKHMELFDEQKGWGFRETVDF
jgi:hypothetical protein